MKENSREQENKQTIKEMTEEANKGEISLMVDLGNLYEFGKLELNKDETITAGIDYDKAFFWYNRAAIFGDTTGLFNYANMYFHGWGCKKDLAFAYLIFEELAQQNCAEALYYLGYYAQEGLSPVEQNYETAIEYYELAAELDDNGWAATNLGVLYAQGKGVKKDEKRALEYFLLALEQGDELGAKNIRALKTR